jgi:hypothetical protein
MALKESHADKVETSSPLERIPPEFAAMGKRRLDELVAIQTERFDKFLEMNRNWLDRMRSEAMIASELTYKLMAARTITEVAMAYQEWTSRHMAMAAEDGTRILADGQRLAETGARLLSIGWLSNGHGGSA